MEDSISHRFSVLSYSTGKLSEFYSIGKEIGRGHFGVVRECRCLSTGVEFACKSVDKSKLKTSTQVNELRTEISAMKELGSHPGIVQLQQEFEDECYVHIVMEKCEGGDLYEYIRTRRRLSEIEAAAILRQIVDALSFCHSKGILHRDLKPENIFITSVSHLYPTVKIGDFGLAVRINPGRYSVGVVGSIYYMAPEVLRKTRYGFLADVWSLGIVLFASLCGYLPFWGKDYEEACAAILQGEIDSSKPPFNSITCQARDLVLSMLSSDIGKRLTLMEISIHPWFDIFPQAILPKPNSPNTPKKITKASHESNVYASLRLGHHTTPPLRSNGNQRNIHPKPLRRFIRRIPVTLTQEELSYLKSIAKAPGLDLSTGSINKTSLDLNSSPKSVMGSCNELLQEID